MDKLIKLFKKYKETILYLVFGGLTTVINLLVYAITTKIFGINYLVCTVIAWILAVIFAYITNKLYVFESKSFKKEVIVKEVTSFFLARLLSLFIDMLIMYVFVSIFKFNDMVIKIISNIVVIIVNYVLSKFIIFKKSV